MSHRTPAGVARAPRVEFTDAPDGLGGMVVVDLDAHRVGEVDGLVVDARERRARMLVVGSGGILGLGRVHRVVPVETVLDISDHVLIGASHETVHSTALYDLGSMGVAQVEDLYDRYDRTVVEDPQRLPSALRGTF